MKKKYSKKDEFNLGYISGFNEAARAFGGCTICYGKGYATVKVQASSSRRKWELNPIKPCSCDRGKQISKNFLNEK